MFMKPSDEQIKRFIHSDSMALFYKTLKVSPLRLCGPKSGGLLDPAVAAANATAALAELDLN